MIEADPSRRLLLAGAAITSVLPPGDTRGVAPSASERMEQLTPAKLRQIGISPRDFGARGDGIADDAEAVQAAVDACLRVSPPRPLTVDGQFRLGRSIIIDRPVDTAGPRFVIAAAGDGGGFRALGKVVMFATRLATDHNPKSEGVLFRDIVFSADRADRDAVCFGNGFLRMTFQACEWYAIRCLQALGYAQSWHFSECRALNWQGTFFAASGAYDVTAQFQAKFGDVMYALVSQTFPTMRVRLHDGVYEGLRDAVLRCGKATALTVDGNYIEFNAAPALDLAADPSGNTAVVIANNTFMQRAEAIADPEFFDVRWGATRNGVSTGNVCNGKLHDTAHMTGPDDLLTLIGDAAPTLYRGFGPDPSGRRAVGNVVAAGAGQFGLAAGARRVALDVSAGGLAVERDGTARRLVFGPANPQVDNAVYGDPVWGAGSRVFNDAPAPGRSKGWICTAGGRPGIWISEGSL